MLKRITSTLMLALLTGCSLPGLTGPPPPEVLPMDYMHAASALAIDDFSKAQGALTALSRNSTGDLRDRAKAAAAAADIETMRERFKALTEEVAIHMSYPDDYAVAFCPRYKDGSKWIQKREAPVANPYLGKSVPACGGFVD